MKILAFDTSSSACSIALSIDGKVTSYHEIAPMQQAKMILPSIDRLLKSAGITIQQLDAIAFGCGPGSFTGVRIATGVAQGLAYAAKKPLIPVSSLRAAAQTAYEEKGWHHILVAVDARMNEVYWASYTVMDNLVVLIGAEHLGKPSEIVLPDTTWCGIGNAWDVYRNEIPVRPSLTDTAILPTARAILVLAEKSFQSGETVSPAEAIPVYLRDEVAKKSNVV